MAARIGVMLGCICGFIGLVASLTDHLWKLGPFGWFTGGILLTLIALGLLLDGVIAVQRMRPH